MKKQSARFGLMLVCLSIGGGNLLSQSIQDPAVTNTFSLPAGVHPALSPSLQLLALPTNPFSVTA